MADIASKLKKRDLYLNRLLAFRDTDLIKVITGIRRCGKSSLLKLMSDYLRADGIEEDQIIEINFESMEFLSMDSKEFYAYVKERALKNKKLYLFFDEVQRVERWQDAVNSFRVDFNCDIYITGSNAHLLSSELSTYLAGRYVEIKMLPLSFKEFIYFHGFTVKEIESPSGGHLKRVINSAGDIFDPKEVLESYIMFGGMPGIADIGLNQEKVLTLLDGIYSAVVVRDILERKNKTGRPQITNPDLLRKIIMFLADNIGSSTSVSSIGNTLVNEGLLDEGPRRVKPAAQTVQGYVNSLIEAFIFYEAKRYDIKGKEYLRTLGKYYIVDTGLRNYLLGFRDIDTGHTLENLVYFELFRRGYDVSIGKIDRKEIDFIATKADEKRYIQVTQSLIAPETRERELAPLRMVRDNYKKEVIALEADFITDQDGIKIVKLIDFLLEDYS
ncbi:MAG: ATP-binding protein [Clostridiales bacterium]|nr:ATP-binding protein [Clostridiales bacterium]